MAKEKLDIIISAKDVYSKVMSRAERATINLSRAGKAIGPAFRKGVIVSTVALAALTVETVRAVRAANEQEDAEKALAVALGGVSQELLDQAAALQKVTTFGDEAIIKAQSLLAAFVKDEEQVKAATKATLDLAAAKGMDLSAAADLVSKTLGSSTNALARYGIQVEGAVGSTERLDSLTTNLANVFGGQARAKAETFRGVTKQLSNAFGDLEEQIGFVLTKNTFLIEAVKFGRDTFASLAVTVKENRDQLIGYTKTGLISLVKGIGTAVEVLRFFHNGWLGLKIAGNAAAVGLADSIRLILDGLRLMVMPLDLIFEGMVKIGAIASNPFDKATEAVEQFQLSSRDVLSETIMQIEATNSAYNKVGNTIDGIVVKLTEMEAKQTDVASGAVEQQAIAIAQRQAAQAQELAFIEAFELEKSGVMAGFRAADLSAERKLEADKLAARAGAVAGAKSLMANLATAVGSESKKSFEATKLLSLGQATLDGIAAVQGAFKVGTGIGGPILGGVFAAAAAAATAANLAKIKSTKFGGGGSISAPSAGGVGGGSVTPPAPSLTQTRDTPQQGAQQVVVNVNNPLSDGNWEEMGENIVKSINAAGERNIEIDIRNKAEA